MDLDKKKPESKDSPVIADSTKSSTTSNQTSNIHDYDDDNDDSTPSIWDLYSSAKKLIPLYDRIQNRQVRESTLKLKKYETNSTEATNSTSLSGNSASTSTGTQINTDLLLDDDESNFTTFLLNSDLNYNYINNEDIVSLDLLTPITASPSNFATLKGKRENLNKDNTSLNTNKNLNGTGHIITPTSMEEDSPNNGNSTMNSINPSRLTGGGFSELIDFRNDNDLINTNIDFDIMSEIKRLNRESESIEFTKLASDDKIVRKKSPTDSSNSSHSSNLSTSSSSKFKPISPPNTAPSTIAPKSLISSNSSSTSVQTPPSSSNLPNKIQIEARQSAAKSTSLLSSSAPVSNVQKTLTKCNNCGTTKTPLWRKDPSGNILCNACGLFLKLHGTMRPLSLKTDVIKKRNSKRQSISQQGEGYKNLSSSANSQYQPVQIGISSNSINSSTFHFPQSVPNKSHVNIDSMGLRVSNESNHIQIQPKTPFSKSGTPISNSFNSRTKIVPILPKPASSNSSASSPNYSSNVVNGSTHAQPQDIPQFKRRKSKLNLHLSTSQTSNPSSPSTPYSPSSVAAYSPFNTINNNQPMSSPANNMTNNNINSFVRSVSRNNSFSSASSYNLYQDINYKRGLSYSSNQPANSLNNNGGLTVTFAHTSNITTTSPQSPNTSNLSSQLQSPQDIQQQKPTNFSNLSAGMNAIRMSNNPKSGLSKCVVNNTTNLTNTDDTSMDDLDWLKFDI